MDICVGCEEFGWRDDPPLEIAYTDPVSGDKYCVFHAPAEHKCISGNAFNELVFERIEAGKSGRQTVDGYPLIDFSGAIFSEEIQFRRSGNDIPYAIFSSAIFAADTSFTNITFTNKSKFDGAIFQFGAHFYNTMFEGFSDFSRVSFHANVDFSKAKFMDGVVFTNARFDFESFFIGTTFNSSLDFTQSVFHSEVFLQKSIMNGSTKFIRTKFLDKANFHNASLSQNVLFSANTGSDNAIRLHGLTPESLSRLSFSIIELPLFSFSGVLWPDQLAPEINNESVLYCEELYRAMKQKAAEKHDQLQVSRWHYREKLMAMKRGGNGVFEAVLLRLYWATSGFGERAVRAGVWLVVLLGVSFLANAWTPSWSWNEVIPLSAAANATMASIPFAKDIPGDGWVKAARGFWQFLIAVQFTLFALAVRNRFRR